MVEYFYETFLNPMYLKKNIFFFSHLFIYSFYLFVTIDSYFFFFFTSLAIKDKLYFPIILNKTQITTQHPPTPQKSKAKQSKLSNLKKERKKKKNKNITRKTKRKKPLYAP